MTDDPKIRPIRPAEPVDPLTHEIRQLSANVLTLIGILKHQSEKLDEILERRK